MNDDTMNCLQRALEAWKNNSKRGVIIYDNDHAHFFRRPPMDVSEYGFEYFTAAFGSKADKPLTDEEKHLLKQYIDARKS